jgi:ATPase subunit of ABC transporter with duplicated ATPase domains
MEPKMLILDEPTNGLDGKNWRRIAEFLKSTDKTVMVITHDEKLIAELGWKILRFEEFTGEKREED